MIFKKKFILIVFYISLSLIMLMGICFYHTPKYKVLRAIQNTFIKPQAPFSITETLVLLQAKSISIDTSFTLNQLNLPLLPPKLSSKLSLIEGISLKSTTNYFWLQQKGNMNLTLAFLYKTYLSGSIYADKDALFLQIPDLLEDRFSLNTTTLGKDFNGSIFSDYLDYQISEDYGFTLFPSFFGKTFRWKDAAVQRLEDAYLLQLPDFPPMTLNLDSKNKISDIDFTLSDFICHLTFQENCMEGKLTIQDSFKTPLYHISFEGIYEKQNSPIMASFQLSSLDLQDEKGTFHLNFYGDILLTNSKPVKPLTTGNIYELFHLSKQDIFKISTEIADNLPTSQLKPFLPYLQ